jgi:hypothetical protein
VKSNLRSGRSRKEEARELIERAQDLGIYLELAFGFVIANDRRKPTRWSPPS